MAKSSSHNHPFSAEPSTQAFAEDWGRGSRQLSEASTLSAQSHPLKLLKYLRYRWQNRSFRSKLILLLILGIALPLFITTQITLGFSQQQAIADLDSQLRTDLRLLEEEVLLAEAEVKENASTLAKLVEVADVNISDPNRASTNFGKIDIILKEAVSINPGASLYLITNNQGKVIAQSIQIKKGDFSRYPSLPSGSTPETLEYRPVSQLKNLDFGVISIVADALRMQTSLAGTELLKGNVMEQLGLGAQASIGLRQQTVEGLPELKQPFPEGTFDVDTGKAGLLSMAIVPIQSNNKQVGAAVVGTLINNNFAMVDRLKQKTGVETATIFAQDWRVSTNVPYSDRETRAVGTRVSREVADTVLNQQDIFVGEANIIGYPYRTAYGPIYNHRKAIDGSNAKPVGIVYVGQSQQLIQKNLVSFAFTSYGVGGAVLVLTALVITPIANSFSKSLYRLADFAQRIGVGDRGIRLKPTKRQDEIGILTQRMNQLVAGLESSEEEAQRTAEQVRLNLLLKNLGPDVQQVQDLEPTLNNALQLTRENLNADRVVLYRFTPDGSGMVIAESVAAALPSALHWQAQDACIPEDRLEAYRYGRVTSIQDVADAGLHPQHLQLMQRLKIQSSLIVPILIEDQLFGFLIAHQCLGVRSWQEEEITFLQQTAAQFEQAIGRIMFLEQLKNMAEEQRQRRELLQQRALQLLQAVEAVSRGDLTIEAAVTEDEIGTIADFYNATTESLRKIIIKVQATAQEVIETTTGNEAIVQELTTESNRLATVIAAALEQITTMTEAIWELSATAEQAETAMQQADQIVAAGDTAMNQTVAGFELIRSTVSEAEQKVKDLGDSSQKISKIVDLISAFAAQTHLLALNASIEASRAGEQGLGFVVIADEVRALAEQSAEATKEIKQLVSSIQTNTSEVIHSIESGIKHVGRETNLVNNTRQSLSQVTAANIQTSRLMATIAKMTVAQSQASDTVACTMVDLTKLTRKTVTDITQVSSSSKQLRKVAQTLQEEIERFKVS